MIAIEIDKGQPEECLSSDDDKESDSEQNKAPEGDGVHPHSSIFSLIG